MSHIDERLKEIGISEDEFQAMEFLNRHPLGCINKLEKEDGVKEYLKKFLENNFFNVSENGAYVTTGIFKSYFKYHILEQGGYETS